MKKEALQIILGVIFITLSPLSAEDVPIRDVLMDAACGQCQFGMEGEGCDLAVRFDKKHYWVTGTDIDAHGDAHAEDGLCNAVRKAQASGTIKEDIFIVESLVLLDEDHPN